MFTLINVISIDKYANNVNTFWLCQYFFVPLYQQNKRSSAQRKINLTALTATSVKLHTMTRKQALKIALELLNNGTHQTFELTQMEAIRRGDEIVCKTKDATTASFYHIEEVVKVATALKLAALARVEDDKVVIILF